MTSSNQHPLQTKIASGHPAEPIISPSRLTTSRVATLERDSFQMVKRAGDAGIDITFLGIMPLFRDIRAYACLILTGSSAQRTTRLMPSSRRPRGKRFDALSALASTSPWSTSLTRSPKGGSPFRPMLSTCQNRSQLRSSRQSQQTPSDQYRPPPTLPPSHKGSAEAHSTS